MNSILVIGATVGGIIRAGSREKRIAEEVVQ
jgi:hypothetical protein